MAAALGHVAAELCLSGRWPVQIAIKQAREEKGWTQQELADEMDMDLRTVRKVEDGKGNPLATVLAGYMYLLEISPNILFRVEPCEEGILMDHLFRQLLNLKPEHIMMVCESAVHIRKWRDNHPDVLTLQDYFDAVNKDEVNETN